MTAGLFRVIDARRAVLMALRELVLTIYLSLLYDSLFGSETSGSRSTEA